VSQAGAGQGRTEAEAGRGGVRGVVSLLEDVEKERIWIWLGSTKVLF
jgi:hypothetical protein